MAADVGSNRPKRHGQDDTLAARILLQWFDEVRRDLPWRESRDPWGVWVSEVMLQQTQVDRVVSYWSRFMERFPTVRSCAEAEVDEVLALWSGLGYYRRARQLWQGAQFVAAAGAPARWPQTVEAWRGVPGVGEYTAAALASQCSQRVVLAVDANVRRVLSRLIGIEGGKRPPATAGRLRERGMQLLDPVRPGDSNQALMELGALVCRPRQPRCHECPLRSGCFAAGTLRPDLFGAATRKTEKVEVAIVIAVARQDQSVLMSLRSKEEDLLAGTWELPWVVATSDPAGALGERYGGRWRVGDLLGSLRHTITYRSITARVVVATCEGAGQALVWQQLEGIERLAMSSLFGKALRLSGRLTSHR